MHAAVVEDMLVGGFGVVLHHETMFVVVMRDAMIMHVVMLKRQSLLLNLIEMRPVDQLPCHGNRLAEQTDQQEGGKKTAQGETCK